MEKIRTRLHFRSITEQDCQFLFQTYASTREEELNITGWGEQQKNDFLDWLEYYLSDLKGDKKTRIDNWIKKARKRSKIPTKSSIGKAWGGSKESLLLFRELLIEHELIEYIDEDQFCNNFLGGEFKQKVNWLIDYPSLMRCVDLLVFAFNKKYLVGKAQLPSPTLLQKHMTNNGKTLDIGQYLNARATYKEGGDTKYEVISHQIADEIKKNFY